MKEAQVNFEHFMDGLVDHWHETSAEFGANGRKSLQVAVGRQMYRTVVNGKVVYEGIQPYPAVDAYNNGFSKFGKTNG